MGDHVQRKVNMNILGKRSAKTDNSASMSVIIVCSLVIVAELRSCPNFIIRI